MNAVIAFALRQRVLIVVLLFAVMGVGLISFLKLNIEAYPDPAPPIIEIIAQYPGLRVPHRGSPGRQCRRPPPRVQTESFSQPHPELLRTKNFRVTVAVRSRRESRTGFQSEIVGKFEMNC